MTPGTVHIVGAGLAGLSAAVELVGVGRRVVVHEATQMAGGRCRSYLDPVLGRMLDNGNHLVLSGNEAALAYVDRIGARDRLVGPARAKFPFFDLATGESWTLDFGDGVAPWWIFDSARRAPRTRASDYLGALKLFGRPRARTVADTGVTTSRIYETVLQPFLLAALNNDPAPSSAHLARNVLWETFRRGALTCRPLYAPEGLSTAFVDPAIAYIERRGGIVRFGSRLHAMRFDDNRIAALDCESGAIELSDGDAVVLATPSDIAARLVPELQTPTGFRAIANIHFLTDHASRLAPATGVLNGATQWVFSFPGRLSVTISDASTWLKTPAEDLAQRVWREVARMGELTDALPPWRVVRERKATFAATPEQDERRPGHATRWRNLMLAGDWTNTGLPATIEGAIRSGRRAAQALHLEGHA